MGEKHSGVPEGRGGGTNRQEKVGGGHVGGRCQGESRETKISIRLIFFFFEKRYYHRNHNKKCYWK